MNDMVNHPSHYTDGKYEVIDFIESHYFPYHLGNAIKYICRAGKKDPTKEVEDLEKAKWYLERFIQDTTEFKNTMNMIYHYLNLDYDRKISRYIANDVGTSSISAISGIDCEDFTKDKFGDERPNRSAAIVLITKSLYAPDTLEAYLDIQGAIKCVDSEIDSELQLRCLIE